MPIWERRFPPWRASGADGFGPPAIPAWWQADVAARAGRWSAITVREPKVRHGRQEVRMLWLLADPALNAYVGSSGSVGQPWPGVQQVARVERERCQVRQQRVVKREREVSYAITALSASQADARQVLAALRGHWGIENRIHWVRDVSFDEDRCQVRSRAAPEVLAAGRNLAIALLRRTGHMNIAEALRTFAARPAHAVQLILPVACL